MANPLQQKTRQRKMIYFGAIVVLFTLSLIHREFVVKPQAIRLQLREEAKGDVELTSSAVRLVLIGSRGVAVTMLWYNAMDKQKRAEWNEMELIVKSITKLQPYFITPWLYQAWNISFNVAVECDRPRDKYYYISRGLELLSEGERRNRGSEDTAAGVEAKDRIKYPGNPDMRHYMGFFYQLKIGSSDERLTMRTLLELSCIDPIERDPNNFLGKNEQGRTEVKTDEFFKFAQKYPRTVRRLREQLAYAEPTRIVQFLQEHQDIPSRFKSAQGRKITKSDLKDYRQQFPILPLPEARHWPDPRLETMTNESVDVFLLCRTWYEFSQKPLPPPNDNPRPVNVDYDKKIYRIPKQMVTQLFRAYPARAQVYIAEALEGEGYFDGEGWDVAGAFEGLEGRQQDQTERIGAESKYQSRLAWNKSFEMYREFGRENGLYIPPGEIARLNRLAEPYRKALGITEEENPQSPPSDWREGAKGDSMNAHTKLYYSRYFRKLSNFDAFYDQAEGERDPITAAARRFMFEAERERKGRLFSENTLRLYNQAWALYTHAALKHPRFSQVSSMQEDLCEVHQRYLDASQRLNNETFRKRAAAAASVGFSPYAMEAGPISVHTPESLASALAFWPPTDWKSAVAAQAFTGNYFLDPAGTFNARLAYWPHSNWLDAIVRYHLVSTAEQDKQQMLKVVPTPRRFGPLDSVEFYNGPMAKEFKEDFLFRWIQAATVCQNMSITSTITFPGHEYFLLSRQTTAYDTAPPTNWSVLINSESRRVTADRLGLNR